LPRRVQQGKRVCKQGKSCREECVEARVGATKGVESQCLAGTAHCRYRSLPHKRCRTSIRAPIKQCETSSACQGLVWRVYRCVADVGGGVQGTAQGLFSVLTGVHESPPTSPNSFPLRQHLSFAATAVLSSQALCLCGVLRVTVAMCKCCLLAAYLNVCMCARNM